jgi:hypothetical protein
MKAKHWLLSAWLLASGASAEVYKWVDEQGNTHYADRPPTEVPVKPVELPGLSTFASRPLPAAAEEEAAQPDAASEAFAGYTRVAITAPEDDTAVRANDQRVAVSVAVEPPLQESHRMVILLDGEPAGEPYAGTELQLNGVLRGTHTLQARIIGAQGEMLAESAVISFTLRQITIRPSPRG